MHLSSIFCATGFACHCLRSRERGSHAYGVASNTHKSLTLHFDPLEDLDIKFQPEALLQLRTTDFRELGNFHHG